ncbi:hypothetical protein E0H75_34225 [Kribbella capetownensis]|uniref:Uncharacterized protein n=1 Tax=Kribbella capetownensis TaxID=1572659 RepID=A0A4V2M6Q2_9ACTN|nr:hypothetical protein [Kribbella capetownensis]TCC44622.1 hypothetical protein E0H75_34225 [Kribbella capetownensis]
MDAAAVRRLFQVSFPEVESEDPVEYFGEIGSAVDALVYGWLYWPKLVEQHGAVFLALNGDDEAYIAERLAAAIAASRDEPRGSWAEAVDSFNFFELEYLFGVRPATANVQEDVVQQLGSVLVETWSARLASAYPDRRFSVTLRLADESLMLATRVQVTQRTPALVPPAGWNARVR